LAEDLRSPREFKHAVQVTVVLQTSNACFILLARVIAYNHSIFMLNPRQKLNVIFTIFTRNGKSGQGTFIFDIDIAPTFTCSKLTLAASGQTPQETNSSTTSRPLMHLEA
jgi:hypothetical protein